MVDLMRLSNMEIRRRQGDATNENFVGDQFALISSIIKQCADALEYARSPEFK